VIPMDKDRLFAKFNANPPASAAALREFECKAGLRLPEEYVQFLRQADGGEGFIGNAYLILWRVAELVELNRAYQVAEYAPGLLLFGSDGGGEAFAFDMRTEAKAIVAVPFVGMELELVRPFGSNFGAFLEELFKS
jgi:hypothetical protein